jgi:hypothetical protein
MPPTNPKGNYKSITGVTKTNVPGIYLGGYFEKLNAICDKITFINSFGHEDSGHLGATELVLSGKYHRGADNGEPPMNPSVGSVILKEKGIINGITGIPNYIVTSRIFADGSAWLNSQYKPFEQSGEGIKNLTLNISKNRFNDRVNLLKQLDKSNNDFLDTAVSLLNNDVKDIFDITREDEDTKSLYGENDFAKNLLMARRLCENGCSIVNVSFGSWDTHSYQDMQFKQKVPILDVGLHALITDIYQRSLQKNILVVIVGEFGRTLINLTAGTDHAPSLCSLCLIGGKFSGGQIIGKCDSKSEYVMSNKLNPPNLFATILEHLEINKELTYTDNFGRPTVINDAIPIII